MNLRQRLAGWLRRVADRLDPPSRTSLVYSLAAKVYGANLGFVQSGPVIGHIIDPTGSTGRTFEDCKAEFDNLDPTDAPVLREPRDFG